MLSNELIQKIKNQAVQLDWKVAFGGKADGNRHLFRVNKIIKYLVKKEGGNNKIAQIGGWVHDVSLAWGSDYDQRHVEKYTLKFLRNFKELNEDEIRMISACAISHEAGGKEISIEAKIVHDADVIDKTGVLGIIRHIWKSTNMLEKRILTTKQDLSKIQKHLKSRKTQIYTKTGADIAEQLNKEAVVFFANKNDALKFMNLISIKALAGWTSDRIAKFLLKSENGKLFNNLKKQLACKYLVNV